MNHANVRLVWLSAVMLVAGCGGGGSSALPPPMITLGISSASIVIGQSSTLTWSSSTATNCTASGAWTGSESPNGNLSVSPSTTGTYTYTLSCTSGGSAASTASVTLTVTPVPLAIVTASLPNGQVGTAYSQTIQATGGVAPYSWSISSGTPPDPLALSTSSTDSVDIAGTPHTPAQSVTFAIQVTDSVHQTAVQAYTVSILLQADSLVLSSTALEFGSQLVGVSSGKRSEMLTNMATSPIAIGNISFGGINSTEFSQSNNCGVNLAPSASCTIDITFLPGQIGPRSGALTINDDTAGSPHMVSLDGLGVITGPNLTSSVSSVPFGTQLVGSTSPPMSLTLSNYGTSMVTISHIGATGNFSETDTCVPSLASGASCTVNMTFTPSASGDTTGALSVTDDAPGSPQTISLSGTGSTTTPVLTGYCFSVCGPPVKDTTQCPVGTPSKTPRTVGSSCIPQLPSEVHIDLATSCVVRVPNYGHCETE